VISARRWAAAELLRRARGFSFTSLVAVIDSATRWVDEDEHEYAKALLVASSDRETGTAAYALLVGASSGMDGSE
jgi:hypothetical protein